MSQYKPGKDHDLYDLSPLMPLTPINSSGGRFSSLKEEMDGNSTTELPAKTGVIGSTRRRGPDAGPSIVPVIPPAPPPGLNTSLNNKDSLFVVDDRMWYCRNCNKNLFKSKSHCPSCGNAKPAPGEAVQSSASRSIEENSNNKISATSGQAAVSLAPPGLSTNTPTGLQPRDAALPPVTMKSDRTPLPPGVPQIPSEQQPIHSNTSRIISSAGGLQVGTDQNAQAARPRPRGPATGLSIAPPVPAQLPSPAVPVESDDRQRAETVRSRPRGPETAGASSVWQHPVQSRSPLLHVEPPVLRVPVASQVIPNSDMLKQMLDFGCIIHGAEKALVAVNNSNVADAWDFYIAHSEERGFNDTPMVRNSSVTVPAVPSASVAVPVSASMALTAPPTPAPVTPVSAKVESKISGAETRIRAEQDVFLRTYKTVKCRRKGPHDLRECKFFHGRADRRRDPFVTLYYCSDCTKGANCDAGDDCPKCHSSVERMFHPDLYKTAVCKSAKGCYGAFCAFAHTPEELRRPGNRKADPTTSPVVNDNGSGNATSTATLTPITPPPAAAWKQPTANHTNGGDDSGLSDYWQCGICDELNVAVAEICSTCTAFRSM